MNASPVPPPPGGPTRRVAIVGRPNVGKSALFNRISDETRSLVHDLPGVTRDRLYGKASWEGTSFEIIDTGGLEPGADEPLKASMEKQVDIAIREADILLLVVDGRTGITALDEHIARLLRRTGKPIQLVVNKIDHIKHDGLILEFHRLGVGDPAPVSAIHGTHSGDLLSRVVELLAAEGIEGEPLPGEDAELSITVVGKPNAGKSTLINALVGEDRLLVDSEPGTTRDAIHVPFEFAGQDYVLVDTAGIRRRARIRDPLEQLAASVSLKAIRDAQLTVLLLDATRDLDAQDKRIGGLIQEAKRPCVIAVNKWDTVEDRSRARKSWESLIKKSLHFLAHCPLVFVSGLRRSNLGRLMETVDRVAANRRMLTPTHRLTEMVREATIIHAPPARGGRRLAIYYVTQLKNLMATFVFKVNEPKLADSTYQRYLENLFRRHLGYEGVPISFVFRSDGGPVRRRRGAGETAR